METTGPAKVREGPGPLQRIVTGPSRTVRVLAPRPGRRGNLRRYVPPHGQLALNGLAVANIQYMRDALNTEAWVAAVLSIWAVLPMVLVVRRPLLAWRVAYPLLVFGPVGGKSNEAWPWPPVQIIVFLVVLLAVSLTEDTGVRAWVTGLSIVPAFLYTDQANAFGVAVLLVVIALLGDVLSRRRQGSRALAEQTELTELERARRAILEERARIAREMHDVVAHHMSMIAVRAETAPYRVPEIGEPARAELAGIATSARSALADMRRLLGVLRAEDAEALREPQPGLADVPALVTIARRAGMDVSYAGNELDGVPEAVGLAAYRIVQEALANAARHAPGAEVHLTLRAVPGNLQITVHSGPGTNAATPATGPGHGLIGMRERAELLGGELAAAPDGSGGFLVETSLPYASGVS